MKAELKKHTLNLRDGDWDYLESVYGHSGGRNVSVVIRTVISTFVDRLRSTEGGPTDVNVEVDL